MFSKKRNSHVVLILLVFLTEHVGSCIVKNDSYTTEYKVYHTKYVLYGTVEGYKIQPDLKTPEITTSYGVFFRIYCIYKGDPNDPMLKGKEVVRIDGAGVVRNECYTFEPDFTDSNKDYVVFLNRDGSFLVPSYGTPEIEQDLYELAIYCGMIPIGPMGKSAYIECPSSTPEDCVEYKVPISSAPEKVVSLPTTPVPVKQTTHKKIEVTTHTQGGQELIEHGQASKLPILLSSPSTPLKVVPASTAPSPVEENTTQKSNAVAKLRKDGELNKEGGSKSHSSVNFFFNIHVKLCNN